MKILLLPSTNETFEKALKQAENHLLRRKLVLPGDRILIMDGIPMQQTGGTNFLKLHTV